MFFKPSLSSIITALLDKYFPCHSLETVRLHGPLLVSLFELEPGSKRKLQLLIRSQGVFNPGLLAGITLQHASRERKRGMVALAPCPLRADQWSGSPLLPTDGQDATTQSPHTHLSLVCLCAAEAVSESTSPEENTKPMHLN